MRQSWHDIHPSPPQHGSPDLQEFNCQRSFASGFTLLELMIAFTIFGMVAGLAFSSFRLALNSYEKGQKHIEVEARKRVLEDQIKRQIGSLFPVRPSGSFLKMQEMELQSEQPIEAYSQIPLFYGTRDSLTFVTIAPLLLQENPGLTVVRYGLAEDERGNPYLGTMESRYMGLESFMAMVNTPVEEPLHLVEDVTNVEFLYYGYDSQSEGYQWMNSWVGEEMWSVPEAIRIDYDDNYVLVAVNTGFYGTQGTSGLRAVRRR